MHTKLSKFVFSQLGKRRNLWNLRFNELYLLSANPPGISHINIYSFKKSCIHAISKRIYSTMDAESVHVVFKVVWQCNKMQYDSAIRCSMTRTLAKICPCLKASRHLDISWWIISKQSLHQLDMQSRFASVILLVETEVSFCSRTRLLPGT